jgi:hypothetical protein
LFTAALDSGLYSDSMQEQINMAENIPRLDLGVRVQRSGNTGDHHIQMNEGQTPRII